jgi:hypothetical protein
MSKSNAPVSLLWERLVAVGLTVLISGWALYLLCGHALIQAMYEGRAGGWLNRLIQDQATWPLARYWQKADDLVFTVTAAGLLGLLGYLLARGWRGFSALTRGLWIFASVNLVAVNVLLLASGSPNFSVRRTSLHGTLNFLQGQQMAGGGDSWKPMRVALEYLRMKQPLYTELFFNRQTKFQYPLTSLLVIKGLRRLVGPDQLRPVLDGLSWLAMILLAFFTPLLFEQSLSRAQPARKEAPGERLARCAVLSLLALTFYPALRAYNLGQIQAWLNALVAVQVWAWLTGRTRLAGALAGAACLIKPQQSVLLLWALLRRRWGFLWAAFSVLAIGLTVSIVYYGWQNHVDYLRVLTFISQHGESYFPNQSVNGLLNRLFHNGNNLEWDYNHFAPFHPWVYAGTLLSSALFLLWTLRGRRQRDAGADTADFALMLLASTMASPVAWEHHYGLLVPIFALLTPLALQRRVFGRWTLPGLVASYVLCSQYWTVAKWTAAAPYGLNILQSYLFFGALLVFVLLHQLRAQPAQAGKG